MAPSLTERYVTYSNCDYDGCYYSSWDSWGRWVALVVIIIFVVFVAFVFACINARRRRSQGLPPRYGTGWAGRKGAYNMRAPQQYNQPPAAAPPYSPPAQHPQYTGNTFNSNEGYYGQQSGIELQHPQNTYTPQRGGENDYQPPSGPPPPKGY